MERAILNVATGHYVKGLERLIQAAKVHSESARVFAWRNGFPPGSPMHSEVPYAFKAFALEYAAGLGFKTLLWADASILPVRDMESLWERIERDGYWMSRNGWTNYEWTAEAAYPHLGVTPEQNRKIPHVVATTFGLDLRNPAGKRFYDEYRRLARGAAFCGPWWNANSPNYGNHHGAAPCGPPDVHGHRHDQTAASVCAWKCGFILTDPPDIFAYKGGADERTILVADGGY